MFNSRLMTMNDIVIRSVNHAGTMYVMARFSGMAMEWPPIIHDDKLDKDFSFVSNEVMEGFMIGNYSGYAKYVEVVK